MKQHILEISIPETPETEAPEMQAGVMYEHNATALRFLLPEAFCVSDCRCYAEFVTVSGIARTDYLTPEANGAVLLPIPVEITSQMTALCVFQVVKVSETGKTEQKVTAKTVRLYFSPLQNTEKMLDADHAFSVNMLLEAIRQNTFKGEKGDKGDSYVLTAADKTEITERIDRSFYGLPLQHTAQGVGTLLLRGAGDTPAMSALCVTPAKDAEALSAMKLTVGENMAAGVLDSALYNTFEKDAVNPSYVMIPLYLKPNTAYTFSKLDANKTKWLVSMLVTSGNRQTCFCHSAQDSANLREILFTTDETGIVYLRASGIFVDRENFDYVLAKDWAGLTVTETAATSICRAVFETPLYRIGENCADSFNVLTGEVTRTVAEAVLTASQLEQTAAVLKIGGQTVYRYKLNLPSGAVHKKSAERAGRCSHAKTLAVPLSADTACSSAEENGIMGVFFGTAGAFVYIYSVLGKEDFKTFLSAEQTNGTPLTVRYCRAETVRETAAPAQIPVWYGNPCSLHIAPNTAAVRACYDASISDTVSDLESRIHRLENNI